MKRMFALCAMVCACGSGEGAGPVEVPVRAGVTSSAPIVTDLGYAVELQSFRLAAADLQLTIEGEEHAWRWPGLLVSTAHAHPGHAGGGQVRGELLGPFLFDAFAGGALGTALVYPERYFGLSFSFREASTEDGLSAEDPLVGHTAHLTGVATKGAASVPFDAVIDAGEPKLVGAIFTAEIPREAPGVIELVLLPVDPIEATTLFDDVDFEALPDAHVRPGHEAHNILRRRVTGHAHYAGEWRER